MIKKLVKHGNSVALVIEKPILKMMDVTEDSELTISLENKSLIIRGVKTEDKRSEKSEFRALAKEVIEQYAPVLKRLSKS